MADLKQLAQQIFQETLAAIDIPAVMERKLPLEGSLLYCGETVVELRAFSKIRVVAIGKAAHAMLSGLRALLPPEFKFEGMASAPTPPKRPFSGIQYFTGGHPIPNAESWQAAEAALALLKNSDQSTLVFFLLSGGGSALAELPLDSRLTLQDVQQLYRTLVTCGAPIGDMNAVRKHFSAVKGGRLAAAAGRATKITLAVTDVPADQESMLASGPSLPDPATITDVERILAEFKMLPQFSPSLRCCVEEGKLNETPKETDPAFANAHFVLLLGMDDLFHPAHHASEAKGFFTCCDNTTDDWPVEKAAANLLAQLDALQAANPNRPVALIADGEVSSPVTGNGMGGRNSAFVLACVPNIVGRRIAVLSAGTDGIDGNSPAAGAVADGETLARAMAAGLDCGEAFRQSDAFTFFAGLNDAVVTGPTGNNLRDLRVLLSMPDRAGTTTRLTIS
jgi:hydroxypyruvate reductase